MFLFVIQKCYFLLVALKVRSDSSVICFLLLHPSSDVVLRCCLKKSFTYHKNISVLKYPSECFLQLVHLLPSLLVTAVLRITTNVI